jgi:NAD(P)-dependent dehydrogenase (short-subunit alcohol dehydrogenase family)
VDTREPTGRVAVVTGSGRGIGRAIALGLAAEGAELVLVARDAAALAFVAEEIRAAGGVALAVPADVSDPEAIDRLIASIAAAGMSPPTILINAAGVFGPLQSVAESDPAEWIRTLEVNLYSVLFTTRRFLPGMIAAGWGRILNVTSAAAVHTPGPLNSAYATSKVAIDQLTRHVAAEVEGTGVTANVFHPGDVKTEMFERIREEVAALGSAADANYGPWVEWMERTGGDPVEKAVQLVLRVVRDESGTPNGQFLWITDGLQAPVPTWGPDEGGPSYVGH